VRQAMIQQKLPVAREHLQAAAKLIQNEADKAQVDRLDVMIDNLRQFYTYMNQAIAGLQPTEELALGRERVIIVAITQQGIILRGDGRNYQYSFNALPEPLLSVLIERAFTMTPDSKMVIGTYMAVSPHGNRVRAKQLWEEAARAKPSVGFLMPELGAFGPAAGTVPTGTGPGAGAKKPVGKGKL
jgi:hypothetical protein